jgi:hypothetical protein
MCWPEDYGSAHLWGAARVAGVEQLVTTATDERVNVPRGLVDSDRRVFHAKSQGGSRNRLVANPVESCKVQGKSGN